MQKVLLEIPTRIETERLYLRCYEAGDGPWYYAMSQQNRSHLRLHLRASESSPSSDRVRRYQRA